jgi:hypothetical protein
MIVINRILPAVLAAFWSLTLPALAQTLQHRPTNAATAPAEENPAEAGVYGLSAGTSLQVAIDRSYPMKAGEVIDGQLVYPLYVEGKLAVSAHTRVRGRVTSLMPDRKARWHARLNLDLTPFHTPQVEFDQIELTGRFIPLRTGGAVTGTPLLTLVASGSRPHKPLIAQEWAKARTAVRDRIAFFTAPGFGDRARQMLYSQLPYHPERIEAHMAWTFELAEPVPVPDLPEQSPVETQTSPANLANPEVWSVHALLTSEVTSATAKPGDPVRALVVEPVYDRTHELVVPEGSSLVGRVTISKPARSLGRNGKLRFTFQEVLFPRTSGGSAADRQVQGALGGATSQGKSDLLMDAEGTVTPKSKSSAVAPLLLTILAGRALDDDGNLVAHNGVSSNGFGLVGRIVGVAAGSRTLAAGIGYYAAALSTYNNFLRRGQDVTFPKDTRVEIETTPLRAPVIEPTRR